jgi:hypothetical protein
MWVFTYKFYADGYPYKFKARLVVRGDLQQDYELYQYDVLDVFLNLEIGRTTYVRCPGGYEKELDQLLEFKLLKWKVDVRVVVILEWDAALSTLFTSHLILPQLRSSQQQQRLIAQVAPALNRRKY